LFFSMKECYVCSVGEDAAVLYEGVGKEGRVSVCRKCYFKNKIPLITKKEVPMGDLPGESVRARLSRMAGIKESDEGYKRIKPNLQDVTLRDIIEKNFQEKMGDVKAEEVEGLISKFHWIVMRRRRQKKMTQKELADAILEPVSAIEYLEKGVLPKEHVKFIRKVERVLDIRLLIEARKVFDPSSLAEDAKVGSDFTIGELKNASRKGFFGLFKRRDGEREEMKKDLEEFSNGLEDEVNFGQREDAGKEFDRVIKRAFESEPVVDKKPVKKKVKREEMAPIEEYIGRPKVEEKKDYSKKDLTQKEIDDLLFGRGK